MKASVLSATVKDQLTHENVWQSCLSVIGKRLSSDQFNTWFRPIRPLSLAGSVLTLQLPNRFFYEYIEEHFVEELREALRGQLGPECHLVYHLAPQPQAPAQTIPASEKPQTQTRKAAAPPPDLYIGSDLNPAHTFENYIQGDCNFLGRAAGMAVADLPGGTAYNPMMVYGGVGLGKTHLLQAIGNRVIKLYPAKKVVYVSLEDFTNQFIEAVRGNQIPIFYQYYMQVDVLLLDDIQFLSNREKTQDIFFQIFNSLKQQSKQIVMSSDCPPTQLKGIHERLLSRFKSGLTADLQRPNFETRVAIIKNKMEADGVDLPTDVVEYLARTVDSNIRELEGVLVSLIAQTTLTGREFDMGAARQILQNIVDDIEHEVNIETIQQTVSEYFAVPIDDMKAKRRTKDVVVPRQVAMYFAKEYTDYSLKMIGEHFGGRDHSTVLHAIQSVKEMMETNHIFKNRLQEIEKRFGR